MTRCASAGRQVDAHGGRSTEAERQAASRSPTPRCWNWRAMVLRHREALRPPHGRGVGEATAADGQAVCAAGAARDGASRPGRHRHGGTLRSCAASSRVLASGRAIGNSASAAGQGAHHRRAPPRCRSVRKGDVLVTDMTDPNWEPVMKVAAAIVTNRGGRTCHAAIIARELGIPAVVGCGDATTSLPQGRPVGDGVLRRGRHRPHLRGRCCPSRSPPARAASCRHIPVKIAMNVGNPQPGVQFRAAAQCRRRPGAAGVHHQQRDRRASQAPAWSYALAASRTFEGRRGPSPRAGLRRTRAAFFRDKLVEGIATIAAAFWPKPVILRLSDFKSNEYKQAARRGVNYEPEEENPMLGFPRRLALSRRRTSSDCFELECEALKQGARRDRATPTSRSWCRSCAPSGRGARCGRRCWSRNGLRRGEDGLRHHHDVRAALERGARGRVPRALRRLLHRLQRPDAAHAGPGPRFGPGGRVASTSATPAVQAMLSMAISRLPASQGKYVGICGQGPVRPPGFRALADGAGDRQPFAESRHGRVDLAGVERKHPFRRRKNQRLRSSRCFSRCHSFSRSDGPLIVLEACRLPKRDLGP